MTLHLEFKTVLGYMDSPFAKGSIFVARFGSEYIIDELNELDKKYFQSKLLWNVCFGHKVNGKIIPWDVLVTKKVITHETIRRLEEAFKAASATDEKFYIIDTLLEDYTLTEYEMFRNFDLDD